MIVTQEIMNNLKLEGDESTKVTTEVMFQKVWNYVKNLPNLKEAVEILDYANACSYDVTVLNEELVDNCEVVAMVNTGGSEGIYIDYYLENRTKKKNHRIATIKTLEEGMDAYIKMGMISGALLLAGESFLNFNYCFM